MKTIEAITNTIEQFPLFAEGCKVKVDYLGADLSFAVEPLPCDPIIRRYVDGGAVKQLQFALTSNEQFDEDSALLIDNSDFYQEFEEWLESISRSGALPELDGRKSPHKFETLSKGYIETINGNLARYRIECRLIYTEV